MQTQTCYCFCVRTSQGSFKKKQLLVAMVTRLVTTASIWAFIHMDVQRRERWRCCWMDDPWLLAEESVSAFVAFVSVAGFRPSDQSSFMSLRLCLIQHFWSNHMFVMGWRGFLGRRASLTQLNYWSLEEFDFLLLARLSPEAPHSRAGLHFLSIIVVFYHQDRLSPTVSLHFIYFNVMLPNLWISPHRQCWVFSPAKADKQNKKDIFCRCALILKISDCLHYILIPFLWFFFQKPVKESSDHAVLAALPAPPTLWAVSLTLYRISLSFSPFLSVSLFGFCLFFFLQQFIIAP